jgi:hypothetical protein
MVLPDKSWRWWCLVRGDTRPPHPGGLSKARIIRFTQVMSLLLGFFSMWTAADISIASNQ